MTGSVTFAVIVGRIVTIVNVGVIPLLYALAFLYFLAGVARYTMTGEGEENRDKAKKMMIFGIIGLLILFAVWGLINLMLSFLVDATGVSLT